jgi:cell division protein ZapA
MAQIQVTINGRTYQVACEDGQEAHVARLGLSLNQKVAGLTESVGQVGDARLLLMAGLMLADELSERAGAAPSSDAVSDDPALARLLNRLAERIEAIADAVAQD